MSRTHLLLNEVGARWDDLSFADLEATNGDRERLVELLRVHYGLGQNCAEREIDTVLADFADESAEQWRRNRVRHVKLPVVVEVS